VGRKNVIICVGSLFTQDFLNIFSFSDGRGRQIFSCTWKAEDDDKLGEIKVGAYV
jgi:hypothetical protein